MWCFEELLSAFKDCVITQEQAEDHHRQKLRLFLHKVSESWSCRVKRRKEACLEEALRLLREIPLPELQRLQEEQHLLVLVRLLLSMQLTMVTLSTAFHKVDQMLQYVAEVAAPLVSGETRHCLDSIIHSRQILSFEDVQRVCVFLEDSAAGRTAFSESLPLLIHKLSELFPVLLQQESLRDGATVYVAVKVCVQVFQLLSPRVAPLVWDPVHREPSLQKLLQSLMDVVLGQVCSRDARLLAATAVAMAINTAPDSGAAGATAWSLVKTPPSEPWLLTVGALQVRCDPTGGSGGAGVGRLSLIRGLLTCCPPPVLLSSQPDDDDDEACLLLTALFPLIFDQCEERHASHHFAFEVLTLWMKRVKACLPDFWAWRSVRVMPDGGRLQQRLLHLIWTNGESPVEGVSECVRSAFVLLLDVHHLDCSHFGDSQEEFQEDLLQRTRKLPWESKAKYQRLCSLVPRLGAHLVLEQWGDIPVRLLHCFSSHRLTPTAAELYRCLIRTQRAELCGGSEGSPSEEHLADQWARRWQSVLHRSLTSQSHSSSYLLPVTFQVFPAAVYLLLTALDPGVPAHLHAWASILSAYRAVTGSSLWAPPLSSNRKTFQLALGSAHDEVRVAALQLLSGSPKTTKPPTPEEIQIMTTFIPRNMNCESAPFRQHFHAAVKRFLVRIRDGCLTHIRERTSKKNQERALDQGTGFVDWLSQLSFSNLTAGHNYQRKKTALLLLSAVLETCTDTWSPQRKKGQPPVNISSLIDFAKQRGHWDFFSRGKQLVFLAMLEDSTNEIRELSAELLLRFFPSIPGDVADVLHARSRKLLCSPRVQEAQMGVIMTKVLLQRSREAKETKELKAHEGETIAALMEALTEHYLTANADMMFAARTKPIHGVLSALHRCLAVTPSRLCPPLTCELLLLLENISQLLLGVLYGDRDPSLTDTAAPPSFCDMGNAISSVIGGDGEECVLLSEEHSLVLTCCWHSLKEIGILLGFLVEKVLGESKESSERCLTKEDLMRAAAVFKNILLRCRHWGAVEGCCLGFTKFCRSLLSCSDPQIRDIPAQMLKQGLQVVRSPPSTSVTRRAAGLPMLILCVLSAEEAWLAPSIHSLLETARMPLDENWDQTLDLPQVCAVHTLQTVVRGSGVAGAVLHFAPPICILSLTLLSSSCWSMRNAALQLYSSVCSRMLGQRSSSEEAGPTHHAMSPSAFFIHYAPLRSFLLEELREAARALDGCSSEGRLLLQPSLHPVLTLLAQLQPGAEDPAGALSDFLPPLLRLASSPVFSVRAMASRALVSVAPPADYTKLLLQLTAELPVRPELCRRHNRLHGRLLQIKAVLEKALSSDRSGDELSEVLKRVQACVWLASSAQRCPLLRALYLQVVTCSRSLCSDSFLLKLNDSLMEELLNPPTSIQIGRSSFLKEVVGFLCVDSRRAFQVWSGFSAAERDLQLSLLSWVLEGGSSQRTGLRGGIQRTLEFNLREALSSRSVAETTTYLASLVTVTDRLDASLEDQDQSRSQSSSLEDQDQSRSRSSALEDQDQSRSQSSSLEDQSLDQLFQQLEDQSGGPEFLSQALIVVSLLLSQKPDSRLESGEYQRLCGVLEQQRVAGSPEVLRLACADALCVGGACLMTRAHSSLPSILTRLINTALFLLQDQNLEVRMKTAAFTSRLQKQKTAAAHSSVYMMQVNEALPLLMDFLVEECWDPRGSLEVLLSHLPPSDLPLLLKEASASRCVSLYEQDEANVFVEPSVMAALLLPRLLRLVEKSSQCAALAASLTAWAELSVAELMDGVSVCQSLLSAETSTATWLRLLAEPRFHSTVCSLVAKTALLLGLVTAGGGAPPLCDPPSTLTALQRLCSGLGERGLQVPAALTAALSSLAERR